MSDYEVKLPVLYKWQKEVELAPNRFKLLVVSRQAGKTTLARHIAIKQLINGKRVLWTAPLYSQLLEQYRLIYDRLGKLVSYSANGKELRTITGGQILFKSCDNPNSMRSFNFHYAVIDEAAFIKDLELAWEKAIRPMLLRKKGECLIISTPNGFDYFHKLYEQNNSNDEWFIKKLDWTCCPDFKQEDIDKIRATTPDGAFRQEYEAQFISKQGSIFLPQWLDNLFVDKLPNTPQRKCIAVDLSLGHLHSDNQAIVTIYVKDGIVYVDAINRKMPVDELIVLIKELYIYHKPECVAFEVNGFQVLVADAFMKLFAVPPVISLVDNKVKKETRISRLSNLLMHNKLKIVKNRGGFETFQQLSDFPMAKQCSEGGSGDDTIDAIEIGWRTLIET